MEISEKDVRHLADLSKITLAEAEIPAMKNDLTKILRYVSQLDELDLADVEPTFQTTGLVNIWREDEIQPQVSRDKLLALAPDVKNYQVKVPKVL